MVRPKKERKLCINPESDYFKPRGIPLTELEEILLEADELETLHLACVDDLSQKAAAEKMGVHQSTFHRIHKEAKRKIATAIVQGKAIRIKNENVKDK